jgi:hypothetical protein
MRYLVLVCALLSLPTWAAGTADTGDLVWSCDASKFYTVFEDGDTERTPYDVATGETKTDIYQGPTGELWADFVTLGQGHKQQLSNVPVESTIIDAEVVGQETFTTVIDKVSVILANPEIKQATSYKSYRILKKDRSVYYVGLEIYKGDQVIQRAMMWPDVNILAACD